MKFRALWLVPAISLIMLFCFLRYDAGVLQSMDEKIPIAVSDAMFAGHHLDTNWALAPDIPEFARMPSYGFSSYILFSHAVLSLAASRANDLLILKSINLPVQAAGIALIIFAFWRLGASAVSILVVGGLLIIAPGLVHDAHMARPESLLFLVGAALFAVASSRLPTWAIALIAGLLIGFGTASKITFLATALIVAPRLFELGPAIFRSFLLSAAGAIAGYVAGAPYSLLYLGATLNGIAALREQYGGGHPPHSSITYGFLSQLWWEVSFFLSVYGPGLVIATTLTRKLPPALMGLLIYSIISIIYFATQHVFFERNLIIAYVGIICIAAWSLGERPRVGRTLLVLASAVPMLAYSCFIASLSAKPWRYLDTYLGTAPEFGPYTAMFWALDAKATPPTCGGSFYIFDANDEFTRSTAARFQAEGYSIVDEYRGPFEWIPTSTLHTYLQPNAIIFSCRANAKVVSPIDKQVTGSMPLPTAGS